MQTNEEIAEMFRRRAIDGGAGFAVAFAILQLVQSHDRMRQDLCFGSDGPGYRYPGVLEKLAMEHEAIASALSSRASE